MEERLLARVMGAINDATDAALTEAGLAAATASRPKVEVKRAKAVIGRLLQGLRAAEV